LADEENSNKRVGSSTTGMVRYGTTNAAVGASSSGIPSAAAGKRSTSLPRHKATPASRLAGRGTGTFSNFAYRNNSEYVVLIIAARLALSSLQLHHNESYSLTVVFVHCACSFANGFSYEAQWQWNE
jgi:hypothetical protein